MNPVVLFISILLTYVAVGGMFSLMARENKRSKNTDLVYLPKTYFFIAIICSSFLFVMMIFALKHNATETFWMLLISIILILWMIICFLNWRIEIMEDEFVYQTVFRRRYTFYWDEVKIKQNTDNFIVISAAGRRFIVDPHAIGIESFIHKVYHHRKRG